MFYRTTMVFIVAITLWCLALVNETLATKLSKNAAIDNFSLRSWKMVKNTLRQANTTSREGKLQSRLAAHSAKPKIKVRPQKPAAPPKRKSSENATLRALEKERPSPPAGGPKLAAEFNWRGNDFMRRSVQTPALVDMAIFYYTQAIQQDASDPGLTVNLAIAKLVKGDAVAADTLFAKAFKLSNLDVVKFAELMNLQKDALKFAPNTSLGAVESMFRSFVDQSVAHIDTTLGDWRNRALLRVNGTAPSNIVDTRMVGMRPEDAKEFLYIKPIPLEPEKK